MLFNEARRGDSADQKIFTNIPEIFGDKTKKKNGNKLDERNIVKAKLPKISATKK